MIAEPIIGHRGAARLAPENTLASIRVAAESGVRWIEVDTTLLGDGTAVLSHDSDLKRCTNRRGRLAKLGVADLAHIDAGFRFRPHFSGEPMPTLADALELIQLLGLGLNLEIKAFRIPPARVAAVIKAALDQHWQDHSRLLISSFEFEVLQRYRQLDRQAQLGVLFDRIPTGWQRYLQAVDASSLHCNWKYLVPNQAQAIKEAGYDLYCYTCNKVSKAEQLFRCGVDGIFTDCPHLFDERLNRRTEP